MAPAAVFKRLVVPDRLDLRDRLYEPAVAKAPPARLDSLRPRPGGKTITLPVLDQGATSACTGFALSNVANYLLIRAGRAREAPVAPFMIYSMARRYDEFPGTRDEGSSLRGAMKGWYKHGVCASGLWKTIDMPPAKKDPADDWWQDAALRPLGAYYRVDTRSVSDMHVALDEVGVVYASAVCHAGWEEGLRLPAARRRGWRIPFRKAGPADGGHAFVIVGYDEHGFLVLNSWGKAWGDGGLATLTYEDWLAHAMDCWVAQLGVVTSTHLTVAGALSLRMPEAGQVALAGERVLRNRELAPFVVDMENNGALSHTGEFRTNEDDLRALVTTHLAEFRRQWGLGQTQPVDVAIYAHGGLTSENTAADTAARWIPALYQARVFPIFLMWETDLLSTLKNRLEDVVAGLARPTAGLAERLQQWWNQRLERALAGPGSMIWGEMKQNAEAISGNDRSGARLLYRIAQAAKAFDPARVRLHLVGHSAGAIAHSHIVAGLAAAGWRFKTVVFMAPAVRVDTFRATVVPQLQAGTVEAYQQLHLTDEQEQRDETCRPILGYGRSLLYLVSESFEGGVRTPILGMQTAFDREVAGLVPGRIRAWAAPGDASGSATHGGFDDDARTLSHVIGLLRRGQEP